MSTIYEDFHKQKSNPNLCLDLVVVPVLGRAMLDVLQLRSLLDPISTTRLSIKKTPPWTLTSSPFGSLTLRESQKTREERENIAIYREGNL